MTVRRMDNVGLVVEDLEAAIEFFVELGLVRSERASKLVQRAEGAKPIAAKKIYPYDIEAMAALGEHCSMTERRADEALAVPGAVDVGRVEERHPDLESGVDDGPRPLPVEPAAELVAAEPDA